MSLSLQGKTALVTGASQGIGKAIALRFARAGARVLASSWEEEPLNRCVEELCRIRPGCLGYPADVRSEKDVTGFIQHAYQQLGEVHILVNNAGIYPVAPFTKISMAQWRRVMRTNLDGPFLCSKLVGLEMISRRTPGRIINVSSTASQVARPGISHYASSKAALNMLTKVLAIELAPYGVTVNAICPGVIDTEGLLRQRKGPQGAAEHQAKLKNIPLGRLGRPEEVAAAALFLASKDAEYITGACLIVDGGYSLGVSWWPARSP